MRFLVDAQLPLALARHLVAHGHEAEHVYSLGLKGTQDASNWAHAKTTHSTIVTKDEDFVIRRILEAGGPPIVWVRLGNVRRVPLLAKFDQALPQILQTLAGGDDVVELS